MREFIDKTSEKSGTPINRDYLMAIQGFDGSTISINNDGTVITETNSLGHTLVTTINDDGSIDVEFRGERLIRKKITFGQNNEIEEVIY
jgi:hypothetical protein